MKTSSVFLTLGCIISASLDAQVAPLNERIAVSATAAPDYVRQEVGGSGPQPETYIFNEGHRMRSGTRDDGIEKTTFENLLKKLAPDLARQKFYPTRDVENANLLIVVHWGVSQIYDDPLKDASIDGVNAALPAYEAAIREQGFADPGDMNFASDSLAWSQENVQAAQARNAMLLGYAQSLRHFGARNNYISEREKMLYNELSEERYFVVLMAYDYQAIRKEKRSKLLWTTRLSVRSPGNNFTEALPVLSQAGSLVFGRQLNDLVHLKANLREGRVAIGELKYLGVAETVSPESAK